MQEINNNFIFYENSSDEYCCNTYLNVLSAKNEEDEDLELIDTRKVYISSKYYRYAISKDSDKESKFVWYLNYRLNLLHCVDIVDSSCNDAHYYEGCIIDGKIQYEITFNIYVDKRVY